MERRSRSSIGVEDESEEARVPERLWRRPSSQRNRSRAAQCGTFAGFVSAVLHAFSHKRGVGLNGGRMWERSVGPRCSSFVCFSDPHREDKTVAIQMARDTRLEMLFEHVVHRKSLTDEENIVKDLRCWNAWR